MTGGVTLTASSYATPAVRATYDLYEDRVVLAWNTTTSPTARYQIRRDGLLLTTLAATDTTYTDLAGMAGQSYPYCVTRQDGSVLTNLGCDDGRRQLLAATNVAASDGMLHRQDSRHLERPLGHQHRLPRLPRGHARGHARRRRLYDDTAIAALTQGTPYTYCVAPIQGAGEGPQVCDPGTRGSVLPPATISATDGTVPGATRITWAAPRAAPTSTRRARPTRSPATDGDPDGRWRLHGDLDVTGVAGATYTYCVTRNVQTGPASVTASVAVCDNGGFGTLPAPTNVAASDSTRDDRVDVRW